MKNLPLLIVLTCLSISIFGSTTVPDSSYCFWYDLSIEFWENQNRRYYEYNEEELPTNETRQAWNAAINDWENQSKYATSYNDQNLIEEYKYMEWDQDWVNSWHETYSYNTNNFITEWTFQNWDSSKEEWTGGEQYSYAYDGSYNVTLRTYREWDSSTKEFKNISRWTSSYESNLLSIQIFQKFENENWINQYRKVYSYNINNERVSDVKQNWNASLNRWESDSKTFYVFEDGRMIEKTDQYWDDVLQLWINETRYIYSFESDTLLSSEERQYWMNDSVWMSDWRNEFTYNNAGLRSALIFSEYNGSDSAWEFKTQTLYDYDNDESLIEYISQQWNGATNDWLNNYKTSYTRNDLKHTELFENWDTIRNDWIFENKCIDYFSWPASITRNRNNSIELQLFPNPASEEIFIDTENHLEALAIYTIDGKLLYQLNDVQTRKIAINHLPAGQYILVAKGTSHQVYTGRFTKN